MTCELRKTLSPTPTSGRDHCCRVPLMCHSTGASAAPSIGVRASSHFTYGLRASRFSTRSRCGSHWVERLDVSRSAAVAPHIDCRR